MLRVPDQVQFAYAEGEIAPVALPPVAGCPFGKAGIGSGPHAVPGAPRPTKIVLPLLCPVAGAPSEEVRSWNSLRARRLLFVAPALQWYRRALPGWTWWRAVFEPRRWGAMKKGSYGVCAKTPMWVVGSAFPAAAAARARNWATPVPLPSGRRGAASRTWPTGEVTARTDTWWLTGEV